MRKKLTIYQFEHLPTDKIVLVPLKWNIHEVYLE